MNVLCQKIEIAIWLPGTLGRAEHGLGNLDAADVQMRKGFQQFMALGHTRGAVRVAGSWGTLAVDQGNLPLALERYGEGLRLAVADEEVRFIAFNLRMIATVWTMSGEYLRAARMTGAIRALEEGHGPSMVNAAMDENVEQAGLELIERALSTAELEVAIEHGRRLRLDAAVEEALAAPVDLEP